MPGQAKEQAEGRAREQANEHRRGYERQAEEIVNPAEDSEKGEARGCEGGCGRENKHSKECYA
jgi:hypothetical protein